MLSTTTPTEDKWAELATSDSVSKQNKLNALLANEVLQEKRRQRQDDVENDHPIALFTRQKNRGTAISCTTLFLLTLIHGVQIVALYNYNSLSGVLLTDSINDYVERLSWISSNATIQFGTAVEKHDAIRLQIGKSEHVALGIMEKFDYCLSSDGFYISIFNVIVGLGFVYLFIFADVWKVIFGTTITRNFPTDPHFKLQVFGAFWLVCLNAAILTWLGVESGFSVVASSGDFYAVLFNSLSIFIILSLDETVLPLVRYFVEDAGHLDEQGNMSAERLALITHGSQYYKPGYGQSWIRLLRFGSGPLRVVSILNIFVTITIVVAPLAVTIDYALKTFVKC